MFVCVCLCCMCMCIGVCVRVCCMSPSLSLPLAPSRSLSLSLTLLLCAGRLCSKHCVCQRKLSTPRNAKRKRKRKTFSCFCCLIDSSSISILPQLLGFRFLLFLLLSCSPSLLVLCSSICHALRMLGAHGCWRCGFAPASSRRPHHTAATMCRGSSPIEVTTTC